jgi:PPM family protein phosphatase
MLRVAEQYAATDTGRQRRANEDSLLARSPLFVVADGMGGAQAGEVASKIAIEAFAGDLGEVREPEGTLAARAGAANARIYELSHASAEHAGMGTTLTAAYVGPEEVALAHVGDSRAYRLRGGELMRLTDDHSLVDELLRQGKITPEEAADHPQRSVITRALGPEPAVEIDTRSYSARTGDVYLLCSDGLTTMVPEQRLTEILNARSGLRQAGETLIAAANEAGGRDNITVVLFRLEDPAAAVGAPSPAEPTTQTQPTVDDDAGAAPPATGAPAPSPSASERAISLVTAPEPAAAGDASTTAPATAAPATTTPATAAPATTTPAATAPPAPVRRLRPRAPVAGTRRAGKRGRARRAAPALALLAVLGLLAAGAFLTLESVYFIGTNSRGLITLYRGVPYQLPGGIKLYTTEYVTGVSAATLTPKRRQALLDHSLRSEKDAGGLLRSLELGQLHE